MCELPEADYCSSAVWTAWLEAFGADPQWLMETRGRSCTAMWKPVILAVTAAAVATWLSASWLEHTSQWATAVKQTCTSRHNHFRSSFCQEETKQHLRTHCCRLRVFVLVWTRVGSTSRFWSVFTLNGQLLSENCILIKWDRFKSFRTEAAFICWMHNS